MLALVSVSCVFESAQAQSGKELPAADKARVEVAKLGVGQKARVEVRLRDDARLKGYVSQVGDASFNVTDPKTSKTSTVAYADVARVKRPGTGLSTRSWVLIGAAATAAVILAALARPVLCDGGAQDRGIC